MRDVVVIGGGLSGLSACYELEKAGVGYTLIEVKPRVGGSIACDSVEGCIIDSAQMCHVIADPVNFYTYLERLDLQDALYSVNDRLNAFKHGTETLVSRLDERIHPHRLSRMAVSTLGEFDNRYSICMENGMVLDAKALIVASPARYAERMFHTLVQEISFRLLNYRYDNIAYVSMAYKHRDVPYIPDTPPDDYPLTFIHHTDQPERVRKNHVLIQLGVRFEGEPDAQLPWEIAALFGWSFTPLAQRIHVWSESNPVMWRDPNHADNMRHIQHLLPQGVALAGSDYIATGAPPRLDERIKSGQAAARRVLDYID